MIVGTLFLLASQSQAALTLTNGDFDNDADLGGGYDETTAPSSWFWDNDVDFETFRFGADGNGGWTDNAVGFGTDFVAPDNGYLYQTVGTYDSELGVSLSGIGFNRTTGVQAGDFDVAFYFTTGASFTPGTGVDVSGTGTLIGSVLDVDISGLTGVTASSQAFSHSAIFAGSGISVGDTVWVRLGDSDDTYGLDEPFIDNLSLSTAVPEPSSTALLGLGGLALILRRRK